LPVELEDAGGELEVLEPKHPRTRLEPADIWYHSWQAGAGFGDPLDRAPEAVLRDLLDLAVSPAAAVEIYGVVLGDGRVDDYATEQLRAARRRDRIGRELRPPVPPAPGRLVGDALIVSPGGETCCGRCAEPLGMDGPVGARESAKVIEGSLDPAGPHRGQDYGDLGFRLRRYVCPGCGVQFHAELAYLGERLVPAPTADAETVPYVRRDAEPNT
jgi:N-methylhydantoinase B